MGALQVHVDLDLDGNKITGLADGVAADDAATVGQVGGGGSTELSYVEVTSSLTVTATSDATAQTFVSSAAIAYDGSTRILIEIWCPYMDITGNQAIVLNLYDGSTDLGRIANLETVNGSGLTSETVSGKRFLTPSAATHTFHIKAWKTAGTGTVGAQAGGTATYMPAWLRITTA